MFELNHFRTLAGNSHQMCISPRSIRRSSCLGPSLLSKLQGCRLSAGIGFLAVLDCALLFVACCPQMHVLLCAQGWDGGQARLSGGRKVEKRRDMGLDVSCCLP